MKCENCGLPTEGGYCNCMIINGEFRGDWWKEYQSLKKPLTEKDIAKVLPSLIRELREEYVDNETVISYSDINAGTCIDFAEEIEYSLKVPITILTNDFLVEERDGSDGFEGDGHDKWNKETLLDYNSSPPEPYTVEELGNIIFGYHAWIFVDGKHYDAECPDGVTNLFELPFFKRMLEQDR